MEREDARWPPLFDIPLKVVCLYLLATHLQTSDTRVMLICFSCRSETSGTKARFSAHSGAEVQNVSKVIYRNTLLNQRMRGSSALMLRPGVWHVPERESGCQSNHWSDVIHIIMPWMRHTFYCNISLSPAPTPQLPMPSPPLPSPDHSPAAGCGCSGGIGPDKAEKGYTAVLSL